MKRHEISLQRNALPWLVEKFPVSTLYGKFLGLFQFTGPQPTWWVYKSRHIFFYCVDEFAQAGIQLQTKDSSHGAYTPEELFEILGDIYS